MPDPQPRHIALILGDQLDPNSAALDGFNTACDRIWMAEVPEEATHVWSHKARIALFLAAMRHYAKALRARLAGGLPTLGRASAQQPCCGARPHPRAGPPATAGHGSGR